MRSTTTLLAAATLALLIGLTTNADAPEGFTSLFNGKDLSGWKGLVENPVARAKLSPADLAEKQKAADALAAKNWVIDDGALLYKGDGYDNLVTAADYGDFELQLEWKIAPGADSGLYLRGTPQVQIWDGAVNPVGSGGLFNNKKNESKPSANADKPAGQWNTFRIRMVGPKVSIWLNDQLVVDQVELENYWDAAAPLDSRGPIELQAHTTKVWFRNIYIKPL